MKSDYVLRLDWWKFFGRTKEEARLRILMAQMKDPNAFRRKPYRKKGG